MDMEHVDLFVALRRLTGCEHNVDALIDSYFQDQNNKLEAKLREVWAVSRNELRQLLRDHLHENTYVHARLNPIGVPIELDLSDDNDDTNDDSDDIDSNVSDMSYIDTDFNRYEAFDSDDDASAWSSDSDSDSGVDDERMLIDDHDPWLDEEDFNDETPIGVSLSELREKAKKAKEEASAKLTAKKQARRQKKIQKAVAKAKKMGADQADDIGGIEDQDALIEKFKEVYLAEKKAEANLKLIRSVYKIRDFKRKALKKAEKEAKKELKTINTALLQLEIDTIAAALIGQQQDEGALTTANTLNGEGEDRLTARLENNIPDEKQKAKQLKVVNKLIAKQVKKINKLEKKRAKQEAKLAKAIEAKKKVETDSAAVSEKLAEEQAKLEEADEEVAEIRGRRVSRGLSKKQRAAEKKQNRKDLKAAKKRQSAAKKAVKKASKPLEKLERAAKKATQQVTKFEKAVEKANARIETQLEKSRTVITKRVDKILAKIAKAARGALIKNLRTMTDILADYVDKRISKSSLKRVFKTKGKPGVLNDRIAKLSNILKALQDIVTDNFGNAQKKAFDSFVTGGGKGKKFAKAADKAEKNRKLLDGTDAVPDALTETLGELPKDERKPTSKKTD